MPELLDKMKYQQNVFADILGVSESFISRVISGKSRFSYLMAMNAADILKCKPEDLYDWIED